MKFHVHVEKIIEDGAWVVTKEWYCKFWLPCEEGWEVGTKLLLEITDTGEKVKVPQW